jgi:hypothetical protein
MAKEAFGFFEQMESKKNILKFIFEKNIKMNFAI